MVLVQKVFLLERQRQTLIVIPQGDAAGFRETDILRDLDIVLKSLEEPDIKSLLVDLGHSRYFGTVIIGSIHNMYNVITGRGGKMAICNASDDMLEILRIMKFDTLWPHYPNRKQALKALEA